LCCASRLRRAAGHEEAGDPGASGEETYNRVLELFLDGGIEGSVTISRHDGHRALQLAHFRRFPGCTGRSRPNPGGAHAFPEDRVDEMVSEIEDITGKPGTPTGEPA
jgi:hypothetical protein